MKFFKTRLTKNHGCQFSIIIEVLSAVKSLLFAGSLCLERSKIAKIKIPKYRKREKRLF